MKDGHRAYCDYMIHKTMKSGARIELGKAATADTVLAESPDTLIIAIGAQPIVPPIPGIDGAHVHGVVEVDRGEVELGQKVVLCGVFRAMGCGNGLKLRVRVSKMLRVWLPVIHSSLLCRYE